MTAADTDSLLPGQKDSWLQCLSPASFCANSHIVHSAWLEHGPFAFWLTEAVQPRKIVELGTYNGFSYLTFCQAVRRMGLATACYAVDTWGGDKHSGFYGEDVYSRLVEINERHYADFSRLLRCEFDEALPLIPDESIDILHIDGRHTYEDVKHDFESWRPKISGRGVVLFHDTNEKRQDFGVWRFWSEVAAEYPSFDFLHGHGLGVLAVGPEVPPRLQALLNAKGRQIDAIRNAYMRLGEGVAKHFEIEVVKRRLDENKAQLAEQKAKFEKALEEQRGRAQTAHAQLAEQKAKFEKALEEQRGRAQTAHAQLTEQKAKFEEAIRRQDLLEAKIEAQKAAIKSLSKKERLARERLDRIRQTTSWRAISVLHAGAQFLPGPLRLIARRGIKAIWWGLTPHLLPQRIAFLRARRRAALSVPQQEQVPQFPEKPPVLEGPCTPKEKAAERSSQPALSGAATEKPVPIDNRLFDSAWYANRYPDTPDEPTRAYDHFIREGVKKGYIPHPTFQDVRFPTGVSIPVEHLHRILSSPILSRVPATHYLDIFREKKVLHKLYGTLSDYKREATVKPNLIGANLSENDMRIVGYMDNLKRRLADKYLERPQNDLVSIIMPTCNRAALIADSIASVLVQSYEKWQLIVVDDASDDREAELVVKTFADDRIHYVRLDQRAGNAGSRNEGIRQSSGNIIAYLDDDDQWDPDHLLVLLNEMRDHGFRTAYAAQAIWEGFDERTRLGRSFKAIRFAPFNRSLLENANYISMISFIHERDVLDEVGYFDESLDRYVDWDLFLRMTEVASPLALPCILSHYFQNRVDGSVSSADNKERAIQAIRDRLIQRSDWRRPFHTTDGSEHLAFSLGRASDQARRTKMKMLPAERVQILIPNYESLAELEVSLNSIFEVTTSPFEILIVDNGSSIQTRQELSQMVSSFESTRVIYEDSASGFSHAVNRGLAEILEGDDPVLILNNDTLVTPNWLDELRYVLYKHSDAAMAVPRQVLPSGAKIIKPHVPAAFASFECDINLSAHHSNVLDPEFDREDCLVELSFAPLFCGLIRAEALRLLGGLDARNGPHFRSDWILSDEIRRILNKRIIYTPHSKIYHMQGVATQTFAANKNKHASK